MVREDPSGRPTASGACGTDPGAWQTASGAWPTAPGVHGADPGAWPTAPGACPTTPNAWGAPSAAGVPDPAASADGVEPPDDLYRELAKRLARQGVELGRLRPAHELSASTRGLPAVMGALVEASGPLSPSELARKTGVTDARIANALRVLEARGFVVRSPSPVDRRRVEVTLTDLGRAFVHDHTLAAERLIADFLSELGEDDARDLVRLLDRVLEVLHGRRERGDAMVPPRPASASGGRSWLSHEMGRM